MRLPKFTDHSELNELRRQMGALSLGDLTLVQSSNRLTIAELETLMTGGIDIQSLDEVVVLPDGTLAYKDRRVLLYIRDVAEYGRRGNGSDSMPKYHVSNCKKLRDMRSQRRFNRYVVAARDDGHFQINLMSDGRIRTSIERLRICQYCLGELGFEDFSFNMSTPRRRAIVDGFSLVMYFQKWPRDLLSGEGLHGESSAPLNDYTGDFGEHALAAKSAAGWICQSCLRDLSGASMRRYLHAHHANGVKFDNSPGNLVALCIGCHSSQPGHEHMRGLPQLAEYRARAR